MKYPTVRLKRNLRKSLLQGDPWIYKDAVSVPADIKASGLCKVLDIKDEFVGWGLFSAKSPLAVRMLSLQRSPPQADFFARQMVQALNLRSSAASDTTNCYRLFNGEGDLLPGLICDVYADVAVLQFDGSGPYEFWDHDQIATWILAHTTCKTVYFKPRHDMKADPKTWGVPCGDGLVEVKENGCLFTVDIVNGQKTGFFLDQRDNRHYVKNLAKNKSVLNLFSYSGGFSIYAGLGGASAVCSVDIAEGALKLSEKNWQMNRLPDRHRTVCADVFEFIQTHDDNYDVVICDPPSLAKSEKTKDQAVQKYVETFAGAAKLLNPQGHLILSSCSSHISFADFNEIIVATLSKIRRRAQVLRVSGQGLDHPYPHACPHLRYLKFVDLIVY